MGRFCVARETVLMRDSAGRVGVRWRSSWGCCLCKESNFGGVNGSVKRKKKGEEEEEGNRESSRASSSLSSLMEA